MINVLRIIHIAGLAGISAVVLAGAGGARGWGAVMLISGLGMEWREIRVPRDPGCAVCGTAATTA